jgi:hypothetical protein
MDEHAYPQEQLAAAPAQRRRTRAEADAKFNRRMRTCLLNFSLDVLFQICKISMRYKV